MATYGMPEYPATVAAGDAFNDDTSQLGDNAFNLLSAPSTGVVRAP